MSDWSGLKAAGGTQETLMVLVWPQSMELLEGLREKPSCCNHSIPSRMNSTGFCRDGCVVQMQPTCSSLVAGVPTCHKHHVFAGCTLQLDLVREFLVEEQHLELVGEVQALVVGAEGHNEVLHLPRVHDAGDRDHAEHTPAAVVLCAHEVQPLGLSGEQLPQLLLGGGTGAGEAVQPHGELDEE
ncbi:hypothetical protein H920_16614 [Fukomys damarensis]|uniref:Uncharacterized protein n=1 Tax=Fukomys damarensis TaxID=885580 RepID=A0A091CV78_FUKDA|nr:hypothetical protein H920_16614 [Fukomys damarensis]